MRLLLDTNVLIWWCTDDGRLGLQGRNRIESASAVFVSVVSAWEIAIKTSLRRLSLPEDLSRMIAALHFRKLPLHFEHVAHYPFALPQHKDPFDRMIVAQARAEGLTLVSSDKTLKKNVEPFMDACR